MRPGIIVAAPASGSGKTTLVLGLLAALRARGVAVQPFKCGPDYIDPAFHAAASGRASYNLDSWAMRRGDLVRMVREGTGLGIAEGSMGLFDGVARAGEAGTGANADIAALTGWPVVLVLDVAGQAQSAAAVALGFAAMRPDVVIAGVVANRVASARHEALVRAGMDAAGVRVLGAMPRDATLGLPERHLGLVQAGETPDLAAILARLGAFVERHVDLDALTGLAAGHRVDAPAPPTALPPPGGRIALATDAAFSFVYPHVLARWRAAGAEILPFSPLAGEGPDQSADCCWLPGGYPELHAGALAGAGTWRDGLRAFAETRPVHGECGGYMAMGEALVDAAGVRHRMAGLLGLVTSYEARRMHLGYRAARLAAAMPGIAAGTRLRGHEFHYSTVLEQPDVALAAVEDATGATVAETGSFRRHPRGGMATGSYFHLIGLAS